jgi:hypothetical protein
MNKTKPEENKNKTKIDNGYICCYSSQHSALQCKRKTWSANDQDNVFE